MFNEHENYEEELEVNTSNLDEESKVLKKLSAVSLWQIVFIWPLVSSV